MLQKTSSYFLCFILAFPHLAQASDYSLESIKPEDQQALYKQYPNAKVLRVSAERYPQVAEQLRSQGYNQAAAQLALNDAPALVTPGTQADKKLSDDCGDTGTSAGEDSINVMLDASSDILNTSSSQNHNEAAVVFVIVGTILVVVWTLYVFKYFYDVAAGFRPCGYWSELTLAANRISGSRDGYARFNGINYMTGFRAGATEVGISIELGEADVKLPQLLDQRLQGNYWFIGPVLRWRMTRENNPHYFNMKFLAGTTGHDEMGVIAKANLGIQFGLGESTHLGFSWGAMYLDVKESQGILHDRNEYYYLYGINFGFGF